MNCGKAQEWISLELDDQLEPEHVHGLQTHLEGCADCREFQEDLKLGLRMLNATEPELPDNFDWKLQLKLSNAMREATRESAYPWGEEKPAWRRWIARAGVSAALGMAAVLAVAVLAPQGLQPLGAGSGAMVNLEASPRMPIQSGTSNYFDTTRRPLNTSYSSSSNALGAGLQRRVSSGSAFGQSSWSGTNDQDLLRIRHLEEENEMLRRRLAGQQHHNQRLQAQLDSLGDQAVSRD